ncbi:MAG: heterodisulfide reductase [Deltaproteobacteria bacterium]|nr:MAG: heterodisulfide reductase [Deltaproteobacteria bacterium]
MSYTEIEGIEGEEGNFTVRLLRKPRYVLEHRCTGCRNCVDHCPVEIPDVFNQKLSKEKAIHIYFSQAIPLICYIDPEYCLYLKEGKCGICADICRNSAIDFGQVPQREEVKVGAVVLSMGFDPYDPSVRPEWGYGRLANVISSMDFERITSSTGPYSGEILRPSDLKHPHKVAWIQCVGSRQVYEGSKSYCSAVCCTYTQKQVILMKIHNPEAECVVFHNDIRAFSKGFERFFERTESLPGVRFIRAYPQVVGEDPVSKNVILRYVTPEGKLVEEDFDLVVLSVGLLPPSGIDKVASELGIELNEYGFCKTNPFDFVEATKPGVFVSGSFIAPSDIPEAVYTASGAASKCGRLLGYRRNKLTVPKQYPPEREVVEEEPRVGVFVCHCGANIGKVVSVPSLVEEALKLPYVVHAEEDLFWCSTSGTKRIMEVVKEKGLNRVVVAACTPKTHEPTFMDSIRMGGINMYLVDMANIREHCTWVHPLEGEAAYEKAKELIKMSLARALLLEPLELYEIPIDKRALVVGGGISGMTCALDLAEQGHEVWLVEKERELGGMARRIYWTLEGEDVQGFLRDLIDRVYRHPLIHVLTEAKIIETSGYLGNFVTKVQSGGTVYEIKHGVTILATGAVEYRPTEYLYGKDPRVVTALEFEELLAKRDQKVLEAENVVMIQCVGSRSKERNYCSRICCGETMKNALKLKELNPNCNIYVLYRDMRTYGFKEDLYRKAADLGVVFIRFEPEQQPVVEQVQGAAERALRVRVRDHVLGEEVEIGVDLVVLAAGVVPAPDNQELSEQFKVPLDEDGFFKEAHVKLRPVDFGTEGIFLCGMAHYPKYIQEAIAQAHGASGRAMTILSKEKEVSSGIVCFVDEGRCMGCGACAEVCTYGAILMEETKRGKKPKVIPVLCKGCGLCNSECPTGAIQVKHFKDEQILAEIDVLMASDEELKDIIDKKIKQNKGAKAA